MAKRIQLTPNSWIIKSNNTELGLLFRKNDSYLYLTKTTRLNFVNFEMVEKKFGSITDEIRQTEEVISTIAGYPVRHSNIVILSEDPPIYTKGGNIVFIAGYWGLKYKNGWTAAFCPKQKTCEEYQSVGPFKNRLEMLNHLNHLNNVSNIKEKNE